MIIIFEERVRYINTGKGIVFREGLRTFRNSKNVTGLIWS